MTMRPSAPWPAFSKDERDAVEQVLRSGKVNYWTGQECRQFEEEFANWCGTEKAVAVANGTLALELALRGVGVGAGDEVIVTPRTFIASVSSIITVGATPVFADVDIDSGNISAETIAAVINKKTKAVVLVHLAGWPCDMAPIVALCRQHDIKIIEDCAQAHGAAYNGQSVGSIGDVGAWSFCQDKIMTTGGEGGMVTTSDPSIWNRMWSFKDHGKSWSAVYETDHPPGFRWLHESFGSNYRMTEMQAAIGRMQLRLMQSWQGERHKNAQILIDALSPLAALQNAPIRLPIIDDLQNGSVHAYYKFYAYIRPDGLANGWDRDRVVAELVNRGVVCMQGSCSEVYLEKAFDGLSCGPSERLPNAQQLGETSLMWLVHPGIDEQEMKFIAEETAGVISNAHCG